MTGCSQLEPGGSHLFPERCTDDRPVFCTHCDRREGFALIGLVHSFHYLLLHNKIPQNLVVQNHNTVSVHDSVGQEFEQGRLTLLHTVGQAQSHAWNHLESQLRSPWRVSGPGLLLVWAAWVPFSSVHPLQQASLGLLSWV